MSSRAGVSATSSLEEGATDGSHCEQQSEVWTFELWASWCDQLITRVNNQVGIRYQLKIRHSRNWSSVFWRNAEVWTQVEYQCEVWAPKKVIWARKGSSRKNRVFRVWRSNLGGFPITAAVDSANYWQRNNCSDDHGSCELL